MGSYVCVERENPAISVNFRRALERENTVLVGETPYLGYDCEGLSRDLTARHMHTGRVSIQITETVELIIRIFMSYKEDMNLDRIIRGQGATCIDSTQSGMSTRSAFIGNFGLKYVKNHVRRRNRKTQ